MGGIRRDVVRASLCATVALAGLSCGRPAPPAGAPSPTASVTATATATATATSPAPEPTRATPTATATSTSTETTATATAYFVREGGDRRWVEPETHSLQAPTVAVASAAIEVLLAGDTRDPRLVSLAPAGTRLLGADITDRVLEVDLSAEVRNRPRGSGGEEAFAQQLAWTAAQFDTIDAVRLLVDGNVVSDVWGEVDWSEPVEPVLFALAPVIVDEPRYGAAVAPGPVTVSGTANTFEATVLLQLVDPSGRVVEEGFTTATCGTGCRGDFSHTFDTPAGTPGQWAVVAAESDPSGGEGRPPFTVEMPFSVG